MRSISREKSHNVRIYLLVKVLSHVFVIIELISNYNKSCARDLRDGQILIVLTSTKIQWLISLIV